MKFVSKTHRKNSEVNPQAKSKNGQTALDVAISKNATEVAIYLWESGQIDLSQKSTQSATLRSVEWIRPHVCSPLPLSAYQIGTPGFDVFVIELNLPDTTVTVPKLTHLEGMVVTTHQHQSFLSLIWRDACSLLLLT